MTNIDIADEIQNAKQIIDDEDITKSRLCTSDHVSECVHNYCNEGPLLTRCAKHSLITEYLG